MLGNKGPQCHEGPICLRLGHHCFGTRGTLRDARGMWGLQQDYGGPVVSLLEKLWHGPMLT